MTTDPSAPRGDEAGPERFDPRYDPVFQRGYDPARHAELSERFAAEHPAPEPPHEAVESDPRRQSLARPESVEPVTVPEQDGNAVARHDGEPADESDETDEFARRGTNPFVVALAVYGGALIAGITVAYWISSRSFDDDHFTTRQVLYSLASALGTPALAAGVLAIMAALFAGAVLPRAGRIEAGTRLGFIWAILVIGIVIVVLGGAAQSVARSVAQSMSRTGMSPSDELAFRDTIFLATVASPALIATGMAALVGLVVLGAVHWRRGRVPLARRRRSRPSGGRANPFVRALWLIGLVCAGAGVLIVALTVSVVPSGIPSALIRDPRQLLLVLEPLAPPVVFVSLLTLAGLLVWHAAAWRAQPTFTDSDEGSVRN